MTRNDQYRIDVLDHMVHEKDCDWSTVGECACDAGEMLTALLRSRAEASCPPASGDALREAWNRVEPFIDVPRHTIEAAMAWDAWLDALAATPPERSGLEPQPRPKGPRPAAAPPPPRMGGEDTPDA